MSHSCTTLVALVGKNVKTSNKNKIQSIDKNFSGLSTSLKGVKNYKLLFSEINFYYFYRLQLISLT